MSKNLSFSKIKIISALKDFLLPVLAATLMLGLSFIYDNNFFSTVNNDQAYNLTKVALFAFWFLFFFCAPKAFKATSPLFTKRWARLFAPFMLGYSVIVLLCWPGIIIWDEFWVYARALEYELDHWQSYLTSLAFIQALNLFPSIGTLVFAQNILFIGTVTYVYTKLTVTSGLSKIIGIPLLLFLCFSPAVIQNNLMIFRSSQIAILEVLLISLLYFKRERISSSKLLFGIVTFLVFLISVWRTEGILYTVLVPLCLYFTSKDFTLKKMVVMIFFTCTAAISYMKSSPVSGRYQVTAYLNSLSNILSNSESRTTGIDLEKVDKVVDIKCVQTKASFYETPCFYTGAVRSDFQPEDLAEFKKEYINAVLKNLDIFAGSRLTTLFASSGFSPPSMGYVVQDSITLHLRDSEVMNGAAVVFKNPLNRPLWFKGRDLLTYGLASTRANLASLLVFWNFTPILLGLAFIFIRTLSLRSFYTWYSGIIMIKASLILLFAPGAYFMYYYPVFLGGGLLIMIYIFESRAPVRNGETTYSPQAKG